MENQLTIGAILNVVNALKEQGMTTKEIVKLPIYIGNDDELNGIHTAWYVQPISSDEENDVDFIRLIAEDRHNVEFNGNAILIS